MKTKKVLDNTQSEAMQTTLDVQIDTQLNIARTIVLELMAHPERRERLAEQLNTSLQLVADLRKYGLPIQEEEQTNDLEDESKTITVADPDEDSPDLFNLIYEAWSFAQGAEHLLLQYADSAENENDGEGMYRVLVILTAAVERLKKCNEQC